MHKRNISAILLLCVLIPFAYTESIKPIQVRGRPRLKNGTVTTDTGGMLRGVYWSLDAAGELPDRQSVMEIKEFGMNSLHVYAERHDSGIPAGSYVKQMDTIAKWCGEDGLYCIITIGGGSHNAMFDIDFARIFWNTYAPRYCDMPWVIYEIYNEPDKEGRPPFDEDTIVMEQKMYDAIRKYAPDTMVLLFTYAGSLSLSGIVNDISRLNVDWTNAAVAYHEYWGVSDGIIQPLKSAGINTICTELSISSPFSDEQVNPYNIYKCEKDEVSWMVFMEIKKGYLDSWRFKKIIEKWNLHWNPDSGKWPAGFTGFVQPINLASGKQTVVSSVQNYQGKELLGKYATDGNDLTRWGSEFADNQYMVVDFGKPVKFDTIIIHWDGQYAVEYDVSVSDNMEKWRRIFGKNYSTGPENEFYQKERINVSETARYMKLSLIKRHGVYGFSIYELQVLNALRFR